MWIRSQDKHSICNLDNIDCITDSYDGNPKKTIIEISAFNQKEKTVLGYYKTRKRVIEVLDEICNYYESNENGVFQMPEV